MVVTLEGVFVRRLSRAVQENNVGGGGGGSLIDLPLRQPAAVHLHRPVNNNIVITTGGSPPVRHDGHDTFKNVLYSPLDRIGFNFRTNSSLLSLFIRRVFHAVAS